MHKKLGYPLIFLAAVFLAGGCGKLLIKPQQLPEKAVWPQAGGNAQRSHYSHENLAPPLKLLWVHRASAAVGPTLIAAKDNLYFSSMDGRIEAISISAGNELGYIKSRPSIEATCAYAQGSLIVARRVGRETLFRYDLAVGKVLWKIEAKPIFSEPLIAGEKVIIAGLNGELTSYALADGSQEWRVNLAGQNHATPAFADGRIVVGDDLGTIHCISLNGAACWQLKTEKAIAAPPAISDSIVYIGSTDESFYAIGLADGKEKWKFKSGGKIYNGAAIAQEYVLFGSTDHHVYCLEKVSGAQVWSFETMSVIGTAPVVAGETVYICSLDKNIYALDLKTGKKLWEYQAKGRIRTTPIIVGGKLLFACEDDRLYCFGNQ